MHELRVHPHRFRERLLGAWKVSLNQGSTGYRELRFGEVGFGKQGSKGVYLAVQEAF